LIQFNDYSKEELIGIINQRRLVIKHVVASNQGTSESNQSLLNLIKMFNPHADQFVKLLEKFNITDLSNIHQNLIKDTELTKLWTEGLENTLLIIENTGMDSHDRNILMEGVQSELRRIVMRN